MCRPFGGLVLGRDLRLEAGEAGDALRGAQGREERRTRLHPAGDREGRGGDCGRIRRTRPRRARIPPHAEGEGRRGDGIRRQDDYEGAREDVPLDRGEGPCDGGQLQQPHRASGDDTELSEGRGLPPTRRS